MKFSFKHLLLLLLFACNVGTIFAQAATKEVFNTAVDRINCETIRFIHREAGRAEVANNMDCLSFESIYKTVPADEAGTTGALCKSINDYKNKFKEDKPLDAQLNAVIAFADAKIASKKRKGNVEDFKASLEKIKKDAIDAAKGGATTAGANNGETKTGTEAKSNSAGIDTSKAIAEPASEAPKSGHKTDWLGLLSLLVGLGGLGLAYMAYSKAKKLEGGSAHPVSTTYGNKFTKDDSMQEIMRVEKHFKAEIENLNRTIADILKKDTPISNYAPTAVPEPVKQENTSTYIHIPQEEMEPESEPEIENTDEIAQTTQESEPEDELVPKEEDVVENPDANLISKPEESIEEETREKIMEDAQNDEHHEEQPSSASFGESMEEEVKTAPLFDAAPSIPNLFGAAIPKEESNVPPQSNETVVPQMPINHTTTEPVAQELDPFMPEKEYEDGEAKPVYKFAGLPNADGYFADHSFTDEPGKDSVYEIEMYEDVPNKAFFSIRSNPDVIRRAILNPEVYLAPCCSYSDTSEGKHAIVLLEEGMLRKENNLWMVYEKAKINFE